MRKHFRNALTALVIIIGAGCTTTGHGHLALPDLPHEPIQPAESGQTTALEKPVSGTLPTAATVVNSSSAETATAPAGMVLVCDGNACRLVPAAPAERTWGGEDPERPRYLPESVSPANPVTRVSHYDEDPQWQPVPLVKLGLPQ